MHLDKTDMPEVPSDPHTTLWLTTQDVAGQLQVGVKVIYRAVRRGKLRAARIDYRGDYRFKQAWIDAWVESCATPIEIGGGR